MDIIWSIDTELEEILAEARQASSTSASESEKHSTKDLANIAAKVKKVLSNAEQDKNRIPAIVARLLVCVMCIQYLKPLLTASSGVWYN